MRSLCKPRREGEFALLPLTISISQRSFFAVQNRKTEKTPFSTKKKITTNSILL